MYRIGQRFIHANYTWDGEFDPEEYILAQVSLREVALISLVDGNRWNEPVRVYDVDVITNEEFSRICDSLTKDFTLKLCV